MLSWLRNGALGTTGMCLMLYVSHPRSQCVVRCDIDEMDSHGLASFLHLVLHLFGISLHIIIHFSKFFMMRSSHVLGNSKLDHKIYDAILSARYSKLNIPVEGQGMTGTLTLDTQKLALLPFCQSNEQ